MGKKKTKKVERNNRTNIFGYVFLIIEFYDSFIVTVAYIIYYGIVLLFLVYNIDSFVITTY